MRTSTTEIAVGDIFGRLRTVRNMGRIKGGRSAWECRCACGVMLIVRSESLVNSDTKSCGCYHRMVASKSMPFEDRLRRSTEKQYNDVACLEWTGATDNNGYGSLTSKRRRHKAHRIAWERAFGPIPERLGVLHHCDNPPCCEPTHLFLGSQAINMADAAAKDRVVNGSRIKGAKLTESDIPDIRAMLDDGMPQRLIAHRFKVCQSQISEINAGRAWKYVLNAMDLPIR